MNPSELQNSTSQTDPTPLSATSLPLTVPALVPPLTTIPTPPPPTPPRTELTAAAFSGVLGEVDLLSEPEAERLRICERAIQAGQQTFVEMGLALAEIRDTRLYRNDFSSFDEYCQRRWEFKRGKADYMISAARICHRISATPGLPQPDRESQLRPLFTVSLDDAELAWQYAVQLHHGRAVTTRGVQRAVQELHLPLLHAKPAQPQTRLHKREIRTRISKAMEEILDLITRKADHSALLEKFEALHGQVQLLFAVRKPKKT